MYGPVKMRDSERICNLAVYVVQDSHTLVELMKYDTETGNLFDVNDTAFDRIIWPGNMTSMPAMDTALYRRTY